ncbi:Type I restriction-modification system methyltransferase subunit [Serratia plymuthica]|uniref:class I SAM-dependent DNA methyltransferase n=2 Tax=Serratia TaxID=613 RepID=UPI0021784282|nr:DNA methyltransferase [Serratia plymuthica]CAI0872061.1 Type I restriction-modification system methyltransferase subunit [Serratia plymuthica]
MAVNQAKIFEQLEQLTHELNRDEFIYGFMTAFDFPKATITQVRQGGGSRNVAKEAGHVSLKNKLYYQSALEGEDLDSVFELRLADPTIAKNKIRFLIVTDFVRFLAWDTLSEERLDIELEELHSNYGFFLPLVGLEKAIINSENPADVKAAEKMGKLFDLIRIHNDLSQPADIHALNVFLTRLLFCLFAEDTGIFTSGQFTSAVKSYTGEDGSDLDTFLYQVFSVLNTETNSPHRKNLPAHIAAFPYVNGGLFSSDEPIPELGKKGRKILLECGMMNWSEINPDIFGSMFQAVIDVEQRSRLGQHYTSYSNIMKVIKPLFLDPLKTELDKQRRSVKGLKALLVRLGEIKVFDPACGSGNFLIVAYKELRKLEMEAIKALGDVEPQGFAMSGLHLSQFYGIEIDDFACEVARLSLWLAEHQLNSQWQQAFGFAPPALPLRESGNIHSGNSLRLDWHQVCPKDPEDEVYVIGNPPFLGHVGRSEQQRQDMELVLNNIQGAKSLDFVVCWFWKGAHYVKSSNAALAMVATNSICQGDSAGVFWPAIFSLGLEIHLAYQTFVWKNNARDKAAVHVIIVGFSYNPKSKIIFQEIEGDWHSSAVNNISPYLFEASNIAVVSRSKPTIGTVPKMFSGSMPNDGGHLFLNRHELDELLLKEPQAEKWIRRVLGATEFLHSKERWCLWLLEITEDELKSLPYVNSRVQQVASSRKKSPRKATQELACQPHLFGFISQPAVGYYILVPKVSSERRDYIPIGFFDSNTVSTDLNFIIPAGSLFEFGILTSRSHNDWMRLVAGRLKSDYRYSNTLVYNTFPWPEVIEAQRKQIEHLAEEIILTREEFPGRTLAELYDPNKMPATLLAAHQALDKAVDRLYRERPFKDATDRLSCLLARYEVLTAQ